MYEEYKNNQLLVEFLERKIENSKYQKISVEEFNNIYRYLLIAINKSCLSNEYKYIKDFNDCCVITIYETDAKKVQQLKKSLSKLLIKVGRRDLNYYLYDKYQQRLLTLSDMISKIQFKQDHRNISYDEFYFYYRIAELEVYSKRFDKDLDKYIIFLLYNTKVEECSKTQRARLAYYSEKLKEYYYLTNDQNNQVKLRRSVKDK